MSKKKLSKVLDTLLGEGEDTVDVTEAVKEKRDIDAELAALEKVVEDDLANETDAERLVRQLTEFKLTPMAKELLDKACDNVASFVGQGMKDSEAQKRIQNRAALFTSCDNDLSQVIDALTDALGDQPRDCSSEIFSTCFAVQKAANFIANLQYRRSLDPREDADISDPNGKVGAVRREDGATFSADQREELREAPVGLGPDKLHEFEDPTQDIVDAYVELHDYLQLTTEAYGWDADRPMPYCYVTDNAGISFTPIFDAMTALDVSEVKARANRSKRDVRSSQNLAAAIAARRKLLKGAASR